MPKRYARGGAIRIGHHVKAAVQRSILAVRPARILAVHRHPLYGSENRLWDLDVDAVGEEWRLAQSVAFGLAGGPFKETCRVALELYNLTVGEPRSLLDDRQRRVVCHARELGSLLTVDPSLRACRP